jgi:hypothetical protein
MIKILNEVTGNILKFLLAAGLAIGLTAYTTTAAGAAKAGSGPTAVINNNPYAGSLEHNAEMDALASHLTKYGEISRVVNSILVKLPDKSLFGPGPLDTISPQGELLLTEIGDELRDFKHNVIYITGYLPAENDKLETELQTMGKVDIVERELLSHQIPPSRIETEIERNAADVSGALSGSLASSAQGIELRIVPEQS